MEFITKMEWHDETKAIRELVPDLENTKFLKDYIIHKEIPFKDWIGMSVQAGTGFHSVPNTPVELVEYKAMEMAVTCNGSIVPVGELLPDFPHKDEMGKYLLGDNAAVYGRVPVEIVEEIYQGLKKEYGLR